MSLNYECLAIAGLLCLVIATTYAILNVIAVVWWRSRRGGRTSEPLRPVTVLKPLCGTEPGLYEHLRSFCVQDYPEFQVVFGMRDPADPAHAIALRLQREFPSIVEIVVNPQLHGANYKISNLINMLPSAKHAPLVMADSDACVRPDYLQSVTRSLFDPQVGLVTCLYHGIPTPGIWSRLGAMYVNEWYAPAVLLAWLFGHDGYVSGQTVCMQRSTLDSVGGFGALVDHLADDHRLGQLVLGLGLRVTLSPYLVAGEHHEISLQSVARHELRWMRTLKVLRPLCFRGLFLSFSLPLAVMGWCLTSAVSSVTATADLTVAARILLGTTLIARLALHWLPWVRENWRIHEDRQAQEHRSFLGDLWLIPLRDLLLCGVWCLSFMSSRVRWRGGEFAVDHQGVMRRVS